MKKEEQTMFKKGDYIVTLINDGDCGKVNYCSKQVMDDEILCIEIDTLGNKLNINSTFKFSDKSQTKWRFATKEEGEEYERHGKPYDVGLLTDSADKPSKEELIRQALLIYKPGVKFIDEYHNVEWIVKESEFDNFGNPDQLYVRVEPNSKFPNKNARIYKNGVWARVASDINVPLSSSISDADLMRIVESSTTTMNNLPTQIRVTTPSKDLLSLDIENIYNDEIKLLL